MNQSGTGHQYRLKKRILSALLAVCMLLTMAPTVSAAGNVASVGGTEYATLSEAIAAAQRAAAAGGGEETYTVTLLSDVAAGPFSEAVTGKVILNLAGFSITLSSMFNPTVISVMSGGNLTLKGSGEISTDGNNVIDNQGILTVMDTVKLTSNRFYGLNNQKTANLYGGYFSGYTAKSSATVNLKNGGDAYKAVYTANETEFSLPNGACTISSDFKVVAAAPPVPDAPVAQIGSTKYTSLNDAFLSLHTTPGTAAQPVEIEVLADCGSLSTLNVPVNSHVVLKSGVGGPYTVSRLSNGMDGLVSVYGVLTTENLVLDGGAASGFSSKSALVTLVQMPGEPVPLLTLGQGALIQNNRNESSQGGGVYNWGGTLTLNGGKICGNSVTGTHMGGGGVYLETLDAVTTLNLLDGQIRDNTASFAGGVAIGSGAVVTASGSPVIRDNTQNGVESNLYFSDTSLNLTNSLSAGADLGVTLESGTNGLGILVPIAEAKDNYTITEGDYAHFHKDGASAVHELRFQNGAVSLYEPVSVTYGANSGEGNPPGDGGKYAQGDKVTVLFAPSLTRPGHFFRGWATSSSITAPDYTQNGVTEFIVPGYSHIPLFAIWEQNPQVFTDVAADITKTSAKLTGSVTVYGGYTPSSGFYLTKPTGRETFASGGSGTLSAAPTGLTPGVEYEYQAFTDYNGVRYLGDSRRFRTQPETAMPPTGAIDGTVTNNTGSVCSVTVTIEEGNIIRATQTLANVGDGASAPFSFTALPDGFYNVVADNGSYKVTRMVVIQGGAAVVNVTLALGKTQSVVEIVTPDTPPAAVDNLPEQFQDANIVTDSKNGYTTEDRTVVTSGGTVELKLAVERKSESAVADDASLITTEAAGQTIPLYLDLSVIKTVIPINGSTTETKLASVPKLLTVVLPLPSDMAGKQDITIYRVHNGSAETLPKSDPGSDGEWAEIQVSSAILHIRQFSTYAVGYKTPPASSGSSSGGRTEYPPVMENGGHGTASVSPKSPGYGDQVIITPAPDQDYATDQVIITDKNGKEITVQENGDGTYTFTQPSGKVTITVTFRPERPTWNPFWDISKSDWFHDSVKYAYEKDLMSGTGSSTFRPYWNTSRGMIITILWNVEGNPKSSKAAGYADVTPEQYYADAVNWGTEKGIIVGYGHGLYGPDDSITREQLVTILYHYGEFKKWDVSPEEDTNILSYRDFSEISQYAIPTIQWAVGSGIMSGKGNGILDPLGNATRAETASMLTHFLSEH